MRPHLGKMRPSGQFVWKVGKSALELGNFFPSFSLYFFSYLVSGNLALSGLKLLGSTSDFHYFGARVAWPWAQTLSHVLAWLSLCDFKRPVNRLAIKIFYTRHKRLKNICSKSITLKLDLSNRNKCVVKLDSIKFNYLLPCAVPH